MNDMKTVYHVEGKLCKDFVGQISYTVCLDQPYEELDIEFSFQPQHFSPEDVTGEMKDYLKEYCAKEYGLVPASEEELEHAIYHDMKTEIHTLATLNDEFIGCIPQPSIEGILKVTILAFSVLLDNTEYSLTVRVR